MKNFVKGIMIRKRVIAAMLAGAVLPWFVAGGADSPAPEKITIVHFGDSTVITSYLPAEQRVDTVLEARLAECYSAQKIEAWNAGQDGDFIRQFLDSGRYEKDVRSKHPRIDIALIRYGQNDLKRFSVEEFEKHLNELCDRLETDYPGISILLETNTYYAVEKLRYLNKRFDPYWETVRQVSRKRNLPLVDVNARRREETDKGNWDFNVRNQVLSRGRFGGLVVDDSKDHLMKDEPTWYSDGHPNFRGVQITADEEFKVLIRTWPHALPSAGTKD